jgi:hypothetical protein
MGRNAQSPIVDPWRILRRAVKMIHTLRAEVASLKAEKEEDWYREGSKGGNNAGKERSGSGD